MIFAILLAVVQPITCHAIKAEWILGRDLAAAVPALAGLPPAAQIGLSPLPGQHRVFGASELKRIALSNHIEEKIPEEACFGWQTAVPDRKEIISAIETTLTGRNPHIEIVEQSLIPAPAGEIVFPLTGLTGNSDKPVIWRGFVRYGDKHQFPIWARVLVTVKESHLVATTDLHGGDLLRTRSVQNRALRRADST